MTGHLELDGEAWKDRGIKTYTSILDMYGASGLFSTKMTYQYLRQQEENIIDQELADFLFSGQMQGVDVTDKELIDYVFSEELEFTKVRNYNRDTDSSLRVFLLSGILGILLFLIGIARYNEHRRKRRAAYAAEIDMENQG